MEIIWSIRARKSLSDIVKYIRKYYPETGSKVRKKILETALTIKPFPEKYPQEERWIGIRNIRYCVIWSYKIINLITEDRIVILDVFDTRQDPEKIKDIIP